MGLLESDTCRRCGEQEESSPHIFHPGHTFTRYRMEIFGSAWLQMTDIRKTSTGWFQLKLIEMCLNETYTKVCVCKHLSDI
jgi:rRNA maturation protein Nop10